MLEVAQHFPSRLGPESKSADAPFSVEEIRAHLEKSAAGLRDRPEPPLYEIASSLEALSSEAERYAGISKNSSAWLTVLEEKIVAVLRTSQTGDELFAIREALDRELKPYRGKMTADQLAMLERRYLDTALLERAKLPRLSLFYLH